MAAHPDPLFTAPPFSAHALTRADTARLQRFFDANPAYFQLLGGDPAGPDEAAELFDDLPPAGWPYTRVWHVGFADARGDLVAMAELVADLLAPAVWHVGLFIVATDRHGSGDAHQLWQALAGWMQAQGAQWLRLGAVATNPRALRFWLRQGFIPLRVREGVEISERLHTVQTLARPVGEGRIEDYLRLVPRDLPELVPSAGESNLAAPALCLGPDRFLDLAQSASVTREAVRIAWERAYAQLLSALSALGAAGTLYLVFGLQGAGKSTWVARHAVALGPRAVLFEGPLPSRRHRARALAIAREAGCRCVAVWMDTPFDLALQRNAARPGAARIATAALEHVRDALEPPLRDEGFDHILQVRPGAPAVLLVPSEAADAEALATLRVAAMRPSLERIGRFDEQRARQRLLADFDPTLTRWIVLDGERVGFLVLRPQPDAWLLDHLYLQPGRQGQGIGTVVMQQLLAEADAAGAALRVGALRGSDANRFYQRHGFVLVEEGEHDLYYRRPA